MATSLSSLSAQTFRNDHRVRAGVSCSPGTVQDGVAHDNAATAGGGGGFAQMFSAALQAPSHEPRPASPGAAGAATPSHPLDPRHKVGVNPAHNPSGAPADPPSYGSTQAHAQVKLEMTAVSEGAEGSRAHHTDNHRPAWLPIGWDLHRSATTVVDGKADSHTGSQADPKTGAQAEVSIGAASGSVLGSEVAVDKADAAQSVNMGTDAGAAAQWLWVGSSWVSAMVVNTATSAADSAAAVSNPAPLASAIAQSLAPSERQTVTPALARADLEAVRAEAMDAARTTAVAAESGWAERGVLDTAARQQVGRDSAQSFQAEGGMTWLSGSGGMQVHEPMPMKAWSRSDSGALSTSALAQAQEVRSSAVSTAPSTLSALGGSGQGSGAGRGDESASAASFQQNLAALMPSGHTAMALNPNSTAASPAAPASADIHAPLGSAAFAQDVAVQVTRQAVQAGQGTHEVTLHLNPAEMGPVSVAIELRGDQARIEFGAAEHHTRYHLEQSLSALTEALKQEGVALAHSRVHDQVQGQDTRAGGGAAMQAGAQGQGHGHGQEGHAASQQQDSAVLSRGTTPARGSGLTATGLSAQAVPLERASAVVRQAQPGGLDVFI